MNNTVIRFLKKNIVQVATVVFIFILSGCSYTPPPPVKVTLSDQHVDFLDDVKPILDKRCVSCHSCYNSPCQAKLSSFDGIDRGGSKAVVYDGERFSAQDPSRLFIDANSTQQWRYKGFFSLTHSTAKKGFNNSIMALLVDDKKQHPEVVGEYAPEYDTLICAENLEEVGEFQKKHPNHGMPYGFPALKEKEYATIMQWLAQGARGPSGEQQKALKTPSPQAQQEISQWETFLNTNDIKHKMTARYLYEHYFLAHINFTTAPKEFFSLVRSTTPPGEPVDIISTRRPYDDPKVKTFYYRLVKIYSTIVHKTHIVVRIHENELEEAKEEFIDVKWEKEPYLVAYDDPKLNANPFLVYKQIPAEVRYRYLLKHSEFFIRTFIRGPVCKGQIALDVIRDHFWVMFQDPQSDISVMDPNFLRENAYNLSMPIEQGSDMAVLDSFSDEYRQRDQAYYLAKLHKMRELRPDGVGIDDIWKGYKKEHAPLLTVYRHFDSASVHRGAIGKLPETMWVIDYAQFERIYYTLVAGFDIYGNISHQLNIRRYMDFLRMEGEVNFLAYMPKDRRRDMFASWYQGDDVGDNAIEGKKQIDYLNNTIRFKTNSPKQELIERLVDKHFLKASDVHFDKINYVKLGDVVHSAPDTYKNKDDLLQGYRALTVPGTGFIRHVVNSGVNLAFVRVQMNNGEQIRGTFVINRWHSNVNALFGEESRLDSAKDTIDVHRGNIGSYPNIFFNVKEDDLPDFFDMLINFDINEVYLSKYKKYAISRANKNFWKQFDWFQNEFYQEEPIDAGLYDLNRYYKRPWDDLKVSEFEK